MERGAGDTLVRAGILKSAPKAPRPKANTQWGIGQFKEDRRPFIVANCTTCKKSTWRYFGRNSEIDMICSHCGINERPPEHIVAEYKELLSRWRPVASSVPKEIAREARVHVRAGDPNF